MPQNIYKGIPAFITRHNFFSIYKIKSNYYNYFTLDKAKVK